MPSKPVNSANRRVVLAYSGGLDTSFCVPYLKEQGYEVHTLSVDSGGFSKDELKKLEGTATKLGASSHTTIDGRAEVFDRFVSYVVKGNIMRGGVYPLCVGAERVVQAQKLVEHAKKVGAQAVAHGCTGAGNDQVRFDVTIRTLAPDLKIIAPIRELSLSREAEVTYLEQHGVTFPRERKRYSINQGILGTTIGGGETHNAWTTIPDEAYPSTVAPSKVDLEPSNVTLAFEQGLPVKFNSQTLKPYEVLIELNKLGSQYGIGRGVHLGDTVLGIKGRIAFEAPGATILITAHRELEKLTLTKWQSFYKEQLAQAYGMFLHEGQWQNPLMRDLEAFIDSTQRFVSGEVRVRLEAGQCVVEGMRSNHSLMTAGAQYGEGSALWTSTQAEGFCHIMATQSMLAHTAQSDTAQSDAAPAKVSK